MLEKRREDATRIAKFQRTKQQKRTEPSSVAELANAAEERRSSNYIPYESANAHSDTGYIWLLLYMQQNLEIGDMIVFVIYRCRCVVQV